MDFGTQIFLLILGFLIVAVLVLYLLFIYANFKNTPWYVLLSTFIGWFLSFGIVILVPLDVTMSTFHTCMEYSDPNECSVPWINIPKEALEILWKVLYWSSFILCWIIFPVMRSYSVAGHFHKVERLIAAMKDNLIFYIVCFVALIFVAITMLIRGMQSSQLLEVAIVTANAWGLFLVIVLLGYGLVELPKSMWRAANQSRLLKFYQFETVNKKEEVDAARKELTDTLKVVKLYSEKVKSSDPYGEYLETILAECPEEELNEILRGEGEYDPYSYAKIVALHERLLAANNALARAKCLYQIHLDKCFELEDVIMSHNNPDRVIQWSFKPKRSGKFARQRDVLEWFWKVYLEGNILRIMSVIFAILSITIAWSEIFFSVEAVDLSIYSLLLNGIDHLGFAWQWTFAFVPLGYIVTCAYWSLFKFRLFNYYRLVPHRTSDANSLLFNATYLCTLAAPIAYNFLLLVHSDKNSAFANVMVVNAILGSDFYKYFPIILILMCIINIFNLYSRILARCCIKRFRKFAFHEEYSNVNVEQGRLQLLEERNAKGKGVEVRIQSRKPVVLEEEEDIRRPPSVSSTPTTGRASQFPDFKKMFRKEANDKLLEMDNHYPSRGNSKSKREITHV